MSKARELAELSRTVSDSADAVAITIDSSENVTFANDITVTGALTGTSATFTGSVTATSLIASNGVLELDDNGSHNGVINVPASLFINIDSDNGATGEDFVIAKDRASTSGGTELFRVQEDGKVGVGRVPRVGLDVAGEVAIAYDANYGLRFYNQPQNNWSFIGNDVTSSAADLRFGDSTGEVMRASGGNVLVNRTSVFTTAKMEIQSDAGDSSTLALNTIDTDGSILEFYKAGTSVGSIDTHSGAIQVGQGNVNLAFENATDQVYPVNDNGTNNNGDIDLGKSNARFKDLYLSGGAYLGGTAAANKLSDVETGTWTMTLSTGSAAPSIAITNTTGNYTKIGNLVHVRIYSGGMNITSAGTGGSRIGGLPFVISTGASAYSAASFAHTNCFTTEVEAYGAVGNTFLVAVQPNSINAVQYEVANPRYLMFSLVYQTHE